MSNQNEAHDISDDAIQQAEGVWTGFTTVMKYSVIFVVAVLALLGIMFVDW